MKTLLTLLFVALASVVSAQTVIDPNTVALTASVDHDATYTDGTPVLTSYRLDVLDVNGTVAFQLALGKPAYQQSCPTGVAAPCIVIGITTFVATLPAGQTFTGVVAAIGPGGTSLSAPSNPFARAVALRAPAVPTNVKVIKAS